MSTFTNTAREVEMPNGDVVVIHNAPTGGENTTSNIKKFKYDDNGHVTESTAADAEDLNLSGYSTPTTGSTDIGTSDDVQTAIGKLDHQSHIDQTNILYVANKTGKNLLKLDNFDSPLGITYTVNADNSITINKPAAVTDNEWRVIGTITLKAGTYVLSGVGVTGLDPSSFKLSDDHDWNQWNDTYTQAVKTVTEETTITIYINIFATTILNNVTIYPMVCTLEDWNIGHDYTPYALPNYDLTVREAEDRAALAECVDEGAKNLFDHEPVTTTGSDFVFADTPINPLPAGSYVFSYTSNQEETGDAQLVLKNGNTTLTEPIIISKSGRNVIPFTISSTANVILLYTIRAGTYSNFMLCTKTKYDISPNHEPYALPNTDLTRMMTPFFTVPINHNMIYRGQNLGDTLTADQDTALSSGNFTDLYLGDYWTKQITIPAFYEVTAAEPADWSTNYTSYYTKSGDTYTPVTGDTAPTWAANTYYERLVPSQTVTLKAVIADFDTFYAGYASGFAAINSHHAAVVVHGFNNVVWNKTNTTAGGYVNSLIHKWLVGSALPQIETWFGSAKVLSHQKLLTDAITGDAASGWAWSSQKISLLSENQMYGSKVWGGSKATNGGYEPGEAFKHLNVFNHIDANLLFGNKNIWLRDIASADWAASLNYLGHARSSDASYTAFAPAALILLS